MRLDELLQKLNDLKKLPRTGWLFAGTSLSDVEDVAQHSFEATAITLLLTDELNREGVKLSRERALVMAVMHDWSESLVTDFPYTAVKYLNSPGIKQEMEDRAFSELLKGRGEFLKLLEEYRAKKTTEAKLVHAADYLSMLLQAIKYREQGNRSRGLGELWVAVRKDMEPYMKVFKPVAELVHALEKKYSESG
jgi:putative hydrolase of HD superfamily